MLPRLCEQVQESIPYRFTINVKESVNTFMPRAIPEERLSDLYAWDRLAFGQILAHQGYKTKDVLPNRVAKLTWDVDVRREVPATLRATKPKVWLVGSVVCEPGKAYKLK